MALNNIKTGGGNKEKPPAGNHTAALVAVVDLGDQRQEDKKTGRNYWSHRAWFVWELLEHKIAGTTKNHVIGAEVTLALSDTSNLYKWVLARTGKAPDPATFKVADEVGQPCMLSVVNSPGGYPQVKGVAAVPKVMIDRGLVTPATYPLTLLDIEDLVSGKAVVPEWVPWIYGSPVEDWVKASREGGGAPRPRGRKAEAAAQATQAAQYDYEGEGEGQGDDPIPF